MDKTTLYGFKFGVAQLNVSSYMTVTSLKVMKILKKAGSWKGVTEFHVWGHVDEVALVIIQECDWVCESEYVDKK